MKATVVFTHELSKYLEIETLHKPWLSDYTLAWFEVSLERFLKTRHKVNGTN
jgi:hypothetical protein